MSWPADGLPRFVIRETLGMPVMAQSRPGGGGNIKLDIYVMDRAYCHRVVAHVNGGEDHDGRRKHRTRLRMRADAAVIAAALNGGGAA